MMPAFATSPSMLARFSKQIVLASILCSGFSAVAQDGDKGAIPERLKEQASRPLRWIIEGSKLDRRRAISSKPEHAATAARHKLPQAAHAPAAKALRAPDSYAGTSTALAASQAAPDSTASAEAANPSFTETRAKTPPEALTQTAALQLPSKAAVVYAPPLPPLAPDDSLVPLHQDPPEVWRGLCMGKCDKYFFRVSFKVLPSGKVENIRLLESNFPRLRNEVLEAVAKWQYEPIAVARDEEVVLRLIP